MNNDEYIHNEQPTDTDLQNIAKLAREFVAADVHIRSLKMELEKVERYYEEISTVKLPEAMNAVGMAEFKLNNGYSLSVIPIFNVRLTKKNLDKADAWLQDNGHGGMIKRKLEITYPKDYINAELETLLDQLEELGFKAQEVLDVHWSTIQSWANEMKAEGEVIPEDIFNVYVGSKTVITE